MLFQAPPPNLTNQVISITQEKEEPQLYTIKQNDTLEKIASDTHTTVQELFNKNIEVSDPNIIHVGGELTIPAEGEVLTDRPLPVTMPMQHLELETSPQGPRSSGAGISVSGNSYSVGYCTHYAKQMRPDLPNNLGNADTWAIRAGAQGFTISSTPLQGAIGVARGYMHVVYVVGVNPDGTVSISEQNYKGFGIVSTRVAQISEFTYIL